MDELLVIVHVFQMYYITRYRQHLRNRLCKSSWRHVPVCLLQTELLDPDMNALEYMMKEYKDIPLEKMRSVVSVA
jgi:hypothetical protein